METNQNNSNAYRHTHNGVNSPKVEFPNPTTLSLQDNTPLTSGGAAVLSTPDSYALDKTRTRVNEIEARLIELGILQ